MNYPLFLSYDGAIIGNGFVAKINARAEVLASLERNGWWLFGVHPGGMAESGDTLDEAHARLGETLRLIFIDIASESESFDAFKATVKSFFDESDNTTIGDWKAAVQMVRQVGDAALKLPKISADAGYALDVTDATLELNVSLNPPPFEPEQPCAQRTSVPAANVDLSAAA